ncbi:MAG: hypothetical protein WC238_04195 [Parcubacteria group bacterium]|jgi:hypothetical protein
MKTLWWLVLFLALVLLEVMLGPYDFHSRSAASALVFLKAVGVASLIVLFYAAIDRLFKRFS